MVITLTELYSKISKDSGKRNVRGALEVLDKDYNISFHYNLKGVDYFIVEPKNKKP